MDPGCLHKKGAVQIKNTEVDDACSPVTNVLYYMGGLIKKPEHFIYLCRNSLPVAISKLTFYGMIIRKFNSLKIQCFI